MSRARDLANGVTTFAPLASPTFSGTVTVTTIKPPSSTTLIVQDEGGTTALSVDTSGNTALGGSSNSLGTVSSGIMGSSVNLSSAIGNMGSDSVGSYMLARHDEDNVQRTHGATASGSTLIPATTDGGTESGGSLTGTWKLMGYQKSSTTVAEQISLWLRIS